MSELKVNFLERKNAEQVKEEVRESLANYYKYVKRNIKEESKPLIIQRNLENINDYVNALGSALSIRPNLYKINPDTNETTKVSFEEYNKNPEAFFDLFKRNLLVVSYSFGDKYTLGMLSSIDASFSIDAPEKMINVNQGAILEIKKAYDLCNLRFTSEAIITRNTDVKFNGKLYICESLDKNMDYGPDNSIIF